MENNMLQYMIQEQRYRHIRAGYGWPGKDVHADAETRYPNLAAELGWSMVWLYLIADFADVSREIAAAVLEDNEELSGPELRRLARGFGIPRSYLTAPKMCLVDPATNKGKFRRRTLAEMYRQADGMEILRHWQVEEVLDALNSGRPVTYAAYRWAIDTLQDAISAHQREQRGPRSVMWRAAV